MRVPERSGFGIEGKNDHPIYDKVLSLANETFDQYGPFRKEASLFGRNRQLLTL